MAGELEHTATGKRDEDAADADSHTHHLPASSDLELLFGRLAVLSGVLDEESLEAAKQQSDRSNILGELLVELGVMTEETRKAIETLVEQYVAKHASQPQESASVVSPTVSSANPVVGETVSLIGQHPDGHLSPKSFAD